MIVNIKQIELNLPSAVGPMTEAKRNKLAQVIGPAYVMGNVNLVNSIAFVNQGAGETIIVTEGNLIYRREGMDISADFHNPATVLSRIRETLLLDDRSPAAFHVIAHAESNASTTELSVEYFSALSSSEMRKRFPGLRGVGLRITFDHEQYNCDLHVEPFYNNPSVFFFRLGGSVQTPLFLSKIVEDINRFGSYINDDVVDFVTTMTRPE